MPTCRFRAKSVVVSVPQAAAIPVPLAMLAPLALPFPPAQTPWQRLADLPPLNSGSVTCQVVDGALWAVTEGENVCAVGSA